MKPDLDERIPDLTIKRLATGNFELSQAGGVDDPAMIELHPVQVRLLAEEVGIVAAPDPKLVARWTAAHVRRVLAFQERIAELQRLYNDEILDRCGAGIEICLYLRALEDLAEELASDVLPADAEPVERPKAEPPRRTPGRPKQVYPPAPDPLGEASP